jgi:hypothetical protein
MRAGVCLSERACTGRSLFLHAFAFSFVSWRREAFMVWNFKESLVVGQLHLRDVLNDYPTAQLWMHRYNRWVFKCSLVVIMLQLVNIVSSGYVCFVLYPNGYKTYTTFLTSCLLITQVLWHCAKAAYNGLKLGLAYSAIGVELKSYNAVGPNCVKGH